MRAESERKTSLRGLHGWLTKQFLLDIVKLNNYLSLSNMDDMRDKVNLFVMKFLFVLLNAMAILGFLDSLRQFESVCKILVVICSCVVLIINVVGFSVFEIKMLTDKTSDASLLNHLYTMMAVIDQIRSILMFILVIIGTYFKESESLKTLGLKY